MTTAGRPVASASPPSPATPYVAAAAVRQIYSPDCVSCYSTGPSSSSAPAPSHAPRPANRQKTGNAGQPLLDALIKIVDRASRAHERGQELDLLSRLQVLISKVDVGHIDISDRPAAPATQPQRQQKPQKQEKPQQQRQPQPQQPSAAQPSRKGRPQDLPSKPSWASRVKDPPNPLPVVTKLRACDLAGTLVDSADFAEEAAKAATTKLHIIVGVVHELPAASDCIQLAEGSTLSAILDVKLDAGTELKVPTTDRVGATHISNLYLVQRGARAKVLQWTPTLLTSSVPAPAQSKVLRMQVVHPSCSSSAWAELSTRTARQLRTLATQAIPQEKIIDIFQARRSPEDDGNQPLSRLTSA